MTLLINSEKFCILLSLLLALSHAAQVPNKYEVHKAKILLSNTIKLSTDAFQSTTHNGRNLKPPGKYMSNKYSFVNREHCYIGLQVV
jgi:hypothetical protein